MKCAHSDALARGPTAIIVEVAKIIGIRRWSADGVDRQVKALGLRRHHARGRNSTISLEEIAWFITGALQSEIGLTPARSCGDFLRSSEAMSLRIEVSRALDTGSSVLWTSKRGALSRTIEISSDAIGKIALMFGGADAALAAA